jgi:type II secretory pathway predicted ATPase ExeA
MAGSSDTATNIEDIIKQLKARGGREQMLMFLTGPAGSGKSTAVMVSQHFCYEFCLAVGAMCLHRSGSIIAWWCYNLESRLHQSAQTTESRR